MRQRVQGLKKKNILFLAVELWINCKGRWWLLDRKMWCLILPKIWWNVFLLYFHYTCSLSLLVHFFFCLLIFSFSLAFVPSLREPSLFNAWPPNSSTPRCTTPSFLCFVHPLHSSVVHHSTLIKNPLKFTLPFFLNWWNIEEGFSCTRKVWTKLY